MTKKKKKNKISSKKWLKSKAKARTCPKCGAGVYLAIHKDRETCGKCGYTEFKTPKEKISVAVELPEKKKLQKKHLDVAELEILTAEEDAKRLALQAKRDELKKIKEDLE